jgi:radical SAM-linked protein
VHQRWAIWLSVEGDLRFLSHHDTVRALEYAATRAGLPLRYSQGFNPHPHLAVLPPCPVGVTSRDGIVVISLERPDTDGGEAEQSVDAEALVGALQAQAPRGMRFLRAAPLAGKAMPLPRKVRYELPLEKGQQDAVARRLEELAGKDRWVVARRATPKQARPGQAMESRDIDIRPMVTELRLEEGRLSWSAVPCGDAWARPGEMLKLLGLEERMDLAAVERTAVEYNFAPRLA